MGVAPLRWSSVAVAASAGVGVRAGVGGLPAAIKSWASSSSASSSRKWRPWSLSGDQDNEDSEEDEDPGKSDYEDEDPPLLRPEAESGLPLGFGIVGEALEFQVHAAHDFEMGMQEWQLQHLVNGLNFFQRSAQKGYEVGEYFFRWGQYHELAPSDYTKAIRWYKRGARMNHQKCISMLGKLYFMKGHKAVAISWWERVATPAATLITGDGTRGAAKAQYSSVASLQKYSQGGFGGTDGDGLSQWFIAEHAMQQERIRDAVRWWTRSAANGDVDAMMRLALVCAGETLGVPQDLQKARRWIFAAAMHGHKEALERINWTVPKESRPPVERHWIERMENAGWI